MSEKDDFLAELRRRGLSSPAGIHWARLQKILLRYSKVDDGERLLNPLILGGSIACHAAKHERLAEHLDWAERHGCLAEALVYLRCLSDDKWNQSHGDDWGKEHPWVTSTDGDS